LDVTLPDGKRATLEALLTRPDQPGRFPLALINHGTPRDPVAIGIAAPENYSDVSLVFAQHGYAAVVVNRRGYGQSSGQPATNGGLCNDKNYADAANAAAADILAAAARLQHEPWVDARQILLVGHSAGGLGSLAAAAASPPGIVGVVNFAGGGGSPQPDTVCQPERLVQTMHALGQKVHVPSLWIYAANDHFFGPQLARQMFDAFVAGGASAEFDAAPGYGTDGHLFIHATAPQLWWPRVASFLEQLHLPTRAVVNLPPPGTLPTPAGLSALGQQAFASYLASFHYEKAFATNRAGRYGVASGRRSQDDANAAAMAFCQQTGATCTVYASGNQLAR
jgi:dienelactone hydrolase